MKIRSVVFWSHLVTGLAVGVVILCLSISGALLTYERQIISLRACSKSVTGAANLMFLFLLINHLQPRHASIFVFYTQENLLE